MRKMKKKKNSYKEGDGEVLVSKTKSQLAREARKEEPYVLIKNAPYPLVASKKEKERHFS